MPVRRGAPIRNKIEIKAVPMSMGSNDSVSTVIETIHESKESTPSATTIDESSSGDDQSSDTSKKSETSSDHSQSMSVTTIEPSKETSSKESSKDSVSSDASSISRDITSESSRSQTSKSDQDSCDTQCGDNSKCTCAVEVGYVQCGGDYYVKKEGLLLIDASKPALIHLPCCQIYGYGKSITMIIQRPFVCHGVTSRDDINRKPGTYFIGSKFLSSVFWSTSKGWVPIVM